MESRVLSKGAARRLPEQVRSSTYLPIISFACVPFKSRTFHREATRERHVWQRSSDRAQSGHCVRIVLTVGFENQ